MEKKQLLLEKARIILAWHSQLRLVNRLFALDDAYVKSQDVKRIFSEFAVFLQRDVFRDPDYDKTIVKKLKAVLPEYEASFQSGQFPANFEFNFVEFVRDVDDLAAKLILKANKTRKKTH